MMQNTTIIPPAQLWIGHYSYVEQNTIAYLQDFFCAQKRCRVCATCKQLELKQYHAALWLAPEKSYYTIESLESIFNTISFALDREQHFFFVLTKADYLSQACANKLLKSMEEPPTGYHFILLAQQQDLVLSTIQSRCSITQFRTTDHHYEHPLLPFFKKKQNNNLHNFLQVLEKSPITEQESIQLTNYLFNYWLKHYTESIINKNDTEKFECIISSLRQALEYPPMPGSSKIFLKNIFLQIHSQI